MTPSVAETIASVLGRLPASSVNYWSDEDLLDAYNDAVDEIADATEFYESHVVVKRRKLSVYTDLRQILPPSALRVTAVWDVVAQRWLQPTTTKELDETVGRGWERNAGSNSGWWFMQGLWFLGAYPVSGDDVSPLKIYYASCPSHIEMAGGLMTGLTVRPLIPEDMTGAIEEYMLSSLLADGRESTKSVEHWSEFDQMVTQFGDASKQRMSRVRTPRMGARR